MNEWAGIGNFEEFKFRGYDSRTGRFTSVDLVAGDYPWNSTYAFAENDVVRSIDLEGLEKIIYTFTKRNGSWTQTEIQLPKAGPLGDGAMVRYDNGNSVYYYYGKILSEEMGGKAFTKFFEDKVIDKNGNFLTYQIEGEPFTTTGYGHYNDEPWEQKKYPLGSAISPEEANALFDDDYKPRIVGIGANKYENEALTDYAFTSTNKGSNVEKWFLKDKDQANFFISHTGAKSKKVGAGVAKRRSAEQILFTYHKYAVLDFSRPAQKKWGKIFDSLTNPEKDEKEKSEDKKGGPTGQGVYGK